MQMHKTVTIGDAEYPVFLGVGAMMRFQRETGKDALKTMSGIEKALVALAQNPSDDEATLSAFSHIGDMAQIVVAAIQNGLSVSGTPQTAFAQNALSLADNLTLAQLGQIYGVVASTMNPLPQEGEAQPKTTTMATK